MHDTYISNLMMFGLVYVRTHTHISFQQIYAWHMIFHISLMLSWIYLVASSSSIWCLHSPLLIVSFSLLIEGWFLLSLLHKFLWDHEKKTYYSFGFPTLYITTSVHQNLPNFMTFWDCFGICFKMIEKHVIEMTLLYLYVLFSEMKTFQYSHIQI